MVAVEAIERPRSPLPVRALPARPAVNRNEDAVPFRTWLAVVGSALGAFLAVLNIQIVNSSLADIQGAIGAGIDDGGWVSTAYLVTEIIVIPLSGWLAQVLSMRRYMLGTTILFLAFTASCAFAQNLGQMIVLRGLQGFAGGALIPLAFSLMMTVLPRSKQPVGMALYALSAVFAPAIGPTIGGYFNENFGWQTVFFLNLAPGALMVVMLWLSLEPAPMRLELLRQGDWPGIAAMAVGLGSLQTVLEEGNKDDWLGSPFIRDLSIIAAVALALFLVRELTAARPLLNLRLLARRNFGLGTLVNFLMGAAFYGTAFVLPLYLSQVQGYNAEQIGEVLAWIGLPQLLIIPFVPRLMRLVPVKLLIGAGLALFAVSNFMNLDLDRNVAGVQEILPNAVRAVGQALFMSPLAAIATAAIEREQAGSASALFNMMRNLGGAIGIAVLQTFITRREQFHSAVVDAPVSLLDPATRQRIDGLTRYFLAHGAVDPVQAGHAAIVAIGRGIRLQATIMAYGDAFFLMGLMVAAGLVAVAALRRIGAVGGGGGAH